MSILELEGQVLRDTIESNEVVLVDISADWCMPCKQLAPVLENVSQKIGDTALILGANADKNQEFCKQFLVRSVPTMLIFKNGAEVERLNGVKSEEEIIKMLQDVAGVTNED